MSGFWIYYGSKYAKVTHGFEYDLFLQVVWVLYGVNKDQGNDALPFLVFQRDIVNAIFLKYSKEDTLSSSHVGILNMPLVKNKASVRCEKITLITTIWNLNLRDVFLKI